MIQKVEFEHFRALRKLSIPLRSFTVIVGPNASGKTTILKGLQTLLELRNTVPERLCNGERHPLMLATRGFVGTCWIAVETQSRRITFDFTIPPDVSVETLFQQSQPRIDWQFHVKSTSLRSTEWVDLMRDQEARNELPEPKLLKLEPSRLATPSNPSKYRSEIDESGEGLASVLALLYGRDYDTFKKLEQHLCTVVRSVRQIRFDRIPAAGLFGSPSAALGGVGAQEVGETLLFDTVSASGVPASCMSDGTLLVLGLLTVLYTTKRPQLILLDDLEHGLHPKAQRGIVPLMRDLLKTTPSLQIVATTHSPYLVDVLEPEEVRITTLTDQGDVLCQPLDKHPDFERWKDEMSPGEFWSAVGENWISEPPAGSP